MRLDIRGLNQRIHADLREFIERRLRYGLGRFGDRVRSVMIRLEDLNGPRGGLDKRCHIEAQLAGGPLLVVDVQDAELEPAIARASDRIRRRVSDELAQRRRIRKRERLAMQRLPAA